MSGSFSFLWPPWIAAAAAVALPILIHLLGRGEGPTVPVASLRWFPIAEARRARRFRPSDPWLLALRCLALALAALALAAPRQLAPEPLPTEAPPAWDLFDPAVWARRAELSGGDEKLAEMLARSPERGERRALAPGFPLLEEGEGASGEPAEDLWLAVRAADAVAPPGAPFRIAALDRVVALRGERPRLARPVEWVAVREPGVNAWRLGRDAAMVSDADASHRVPLQERPAEDVFPADDAEPAVSPLLVRIAAPADRGPDREVVETAVRALADGGWPVRIQEAEGSNATDVLFRLGSGATASADPARWTFTLDAGGERSCGGIVRPPGTTPGPFAIERCVDSSGEGRTIWRAPDGLPLLTVAGAPERPRYVLASRLDPSWSSLGAEGRFAGWLAESWSAAGLGPPSGELPGSDRRAASPGEGRPRAAPPRPRRRPVPRPWPERWLWVGVGAALVAERLLAAGSSRAGT